MKIFFKVGRHEQWLDVNKNRIKDNKPEPFKWSCTCQDFVFRKLHEKPIGKCKHIKKIFKEDK